MESERREDAKLDLDLLMGAVASMGMAVIKQDDALQKGREAAESLNQILRAHLMEALKESGPAGAISICSMKAPALACHGSPAKIPAEIRQILQEKYPQDQALNYQQGKLRGMVSIIIPGEQ